MPNSSAQRGVAPCLLAIDPGPTRSAVVVVRPGERLGRVRFTYSALIPMTALRYRLKEIVAEAQVTHAAIEQVGLVHRIEARHALVQTARVAGLIEAQCISLLGDDEVTLRPATQWRCALVGKRSADDPSIKRAVGLFVENLPPRTNAHVRDALGLAVVVAREVFRKEPSCNVA